MKQLWVRPYEHEKDCNELSKWLEGTANNLADSAVLAYPSTAILCAHEDRRSIAFMPVQTTVTLESLAINPDATPRETAEALKQLTKTVAFLAQSKQIKEIYFLCADDSTADFALRHGFEEMPHRTLRMKLA